MKICLRFIKQVNVQIAVREFRQDRLEVTHVDDIVDRGEFSHVITLDQLVDLTKKARWSFLAEVHGASVQSAKRAMRFLTPPASARGLHRQRDFVVLCVNYRPLGEEIGVVGNRQLVQIVNRTAQRRGQRNLSVEPVNDSVDDKGSLVRCERSDQFYE